MMLRLARRKQVEKPTLHQVFAKGLFGGEILWEKVVIQIWAVTAAVR